MLRVISGRFVHLLRRILRRLFMCAIIAADRAVEVLVGQLQIVLGSHRLAVPDPFADHVHRVLLDEFRLPG